MTPPGPRPRFACRPTPGALAGPLLCAALMTAAPAAGQVVSPGRLASPHAELEGLRQCTECHELGRAGIDPGRCLACHEPLATRIAAGRGFHGRLEEQDCAACHAEHLGRDADLTRLDTATFRHEDAGFELRGAHARLACRSCHAPELVSAPDVRSHAPSPGFLTRTFLGLPTACAACHRPDSPHGEQFGTRGCEACHDESRWDEAPRFDHAATRFRLTGAHRRVTCGECHAVGGEEPSAADAARARYAGRPHATCAACHTDPHRGAMGAECRACHTTEAWHRVPRGAVEARFEHDRTGFRLTGRHADLECAACHGSGGRAGVRVRHVRGTEGRTYPRPVAGSCAACHLDPHGGELWQGCETCHRDTGWLPTSYGIADHGATAFPLEGAHAAVPCGECHRDAWGGTGLRFRLETACASCHGGEDPHAGMFGGRGCGECHGPTRFTDAVFDHATAPAAECATCHAGDDPHGGQFAARACDHCHEVTSFRVAEFDHGRTAFPLEGAHADAPCSACHRPEPRADGAAVVRYRPLGTACRDCHGGDA